MLHLVEKELESPAEAAEDIPAAAAVSGTNLTEELRLYSCKNILADA
jgi:hypothetical protein